MRRKPSVGLLLFLTLGVPRAAAAQPAAPPERAPEPLPADSADAAPPPPSTTDVAPPPAAPTPPYAPTQPAPAPQSPPAPVMYPPPAAPPMVPGPAVPRTWVRNHDGFYFRLALGVGFLFDSVDSNAVGDAEYKGFGFADDLSLGGTPARGLVIGGAAQDTTAYSPSLQIERAKGQAPNALTLSALGIFADYYFDPHKGFHVRLFLGWALLSADASELEEDPWGFGVTTEFGHDWWVGDEVSLGVAVRFVYSRLSYDRLGVEETHQAVAPGLLGTLTYH